MTRQVQLLEWHTTEVPVVTDPERPWKHYLGEVCPHGRQVVLVDGGLVRDLHDSDFCQGGNGYRYRFVPRGELWVDACMPEDEVALVAFHECEEAELMKIGWTYSRAHDQAKRLEDLVRKLRRTS